jgi:hypothetical protein
MDAYIELLKATYYKERKLLEDSEVFSQEGKLRFLAFRKETLDRAQDNLSISQMLGREDITEEIKDNLLRDRERADKIEENLRKAVAAEIKEIQDNEAAELDNAQYSNEDYAQYLLQLEKVNTLESELENNRLEPGMVYEEQRLITEGKGK